MGMRYALDFKGNAYHGKGKRAKVLKLIERNANILMDNVSGSYGGKAYIIAEALLTLKKINPVAIGDKINSVVLALSLPSNQIGVLVRQQICMELDKQTQSALLEKLRIMIQQPQSSELKLICSKIDNLDKLKGSPEVTQFLRDARESIGRYEMTHSWNHILSREWVFTPVRGDNYCNQCGEFGDCGYTYTDEGAQVEEIAFHKCYTCCYDFALKYGKKLAHSMDAAQK